MRLLTEDPVDPERRRTSGHWDLPLLRQLHCPPVRRRVDYKVVWLVHQSLAGQTPACLTDDVQFVTDTDGRPLRSAAART